MAHKLNDNSIMTWGKEHKGKQMRQVPDSYLLWMWKYKYGTLEILEYIKDNLDNLKE